MTHVSGTCMRLPMGCGRRWNCLVKGWGVAVPCLLAPLTTLVLQPRSYQLGPTSCRTSLFLSFTPCCTAIYMMASEYEYFAVGTQAWFSAVVRNDTTQVSR